MPKVLTSDQGSKFNNSLDTILMEMLGIDHRLTTPYHPQVRTEGCYMYVYAYACLWMVDDYYWIYTYHRLMG